MVISPMRRNLLAFLTGALIALGAVLAVRSAGSDGGPESGATTTPAAKTTASESARIGVPGAHRSRPKHRKRRATAAGSRTPARSSTAAAAAPNAGHPVARPAPTPTQTVPPQTTPSGDGTQTVPGSDPAVPPASGDGSTPPTDTSAAGAAPANPATPDSSVGAPGAP